MVDGAAERQTKISAYILRGSITEPAMALRDATKLSSMSFPVGNVPGTFWWTTPKYRRPSWLAFLEGLPSHVINELKSRSVSAVLFLQVAGRWFAVCFGFGHALIDGAATEPEFGLRAG